MKRKKVIDGKIFVKGSSDGNYIEVNYDFNVEEKIKISECNDEDEFILTGKQLKELQGFWKNNSQTRSSTK